MKTKTLKKTSQAANLERVLRNLESKTTLMPQAPGTPTTCRRIYCSPW